MNDVDGISHYTDPLVYQYLMPTYRLHDDDILQQPFTYKFNVFNHCASPCYTKASDTLSISINSSAVDFIPVLYYLNIKISTVFSFTSISSVNLSDLDFFVLSNSIISPPNIT